MRHCGIGLAGIGLVVATGSAAQADLRAAVLDYARAFDCSADPATLEILATQVLGEAPGAAESAIGTLVAAGEAVGNEFGGIDVLPPLCEPSADQQVYSASVWIEEWLYGAEGCRLPLAELARRAEQQDLSADGFALAMGFLVASGLLAQEGGDIGHRLACLPPVPPPADPLERVASFDESGLRASLYLHVADIGCRVTPEARGGVVEAVAAQLAPLMDVREADGPEVMAAVRARVEEVLDNPGRAYEIEPGTGDLVALYCTP